MYLGLVRVIHVHSQPSEGCLVHCVGSLVVDHPSSFDLNERLRVGTDWGLQEDVLQFRLLLKVMRSTG